MAGLAPVERYARFLETLTRERLGELGDHCAATVRFRDPFNDVSGIDAYARVLGDMFDKTAGVRFIVDEMAGSGPTGFLAWTFRFRTAPGGPLRTIEGISLVRFDASGLVAEHIDCWDAASQIYEGFPIIGSLLRFLKRRIAA